MKHKIIFISKNYPPEIGGLETYSYNLIKEFEKHHDVSKIVLTASNINLVWFIPYSLFLSLYLAWKHSIRHIHLCDALLSPIGVILKLALGARVSVSIHGLDISYKNFLYQLMIPRCVARLDKVICVSRATRNECQRRKIPTHKCVVVSNGIRPDELYLPEPINDSKIRLEKITGRVIHNRKILVTVGRLVKRKGVGWFIDCVMPRLNSDYIYIVAGDGPEFGRIQRVVSRRNLENRVLMLGRVSNDSRKVLLNCADVFIMPNIPVANDIEGFGIAIIEAGSCGLPVVASNLEGIKDAVIDQKTGYLVDEGDIDGFLGRIRAMNLNKVDIRSYVNTRFNWATIYRRYQKEILGCSHKVEREVQ
ncbi:MAG: glycosyltransferase family 4 protein [bacterium]|nr:glycosyltransferase family 4 protein [bacterium]